jgi:hypothetical protein
VFCSFTAVTRVQISLWASIKLNKSKAYTVLISAHYEKYPTRRFTAITRVQIPLRTSPCLGGKVVLQRNYIFKNLDVTWLVGRI